MKRLKCKNKGTNVRRKEIVMAALACFNEFGYSETSIQSICLRAVASTGSIYHHFGSKEQLAREVYLEGIRDYQAGFLKAIEDKEVASEGIFAIIAYHLKWVEENLAWAHYLFQMRHEDFMIRGEIVFNQINEEFFGRIARWFRKHISMGSIHRMPSDLYLPILMGPCQEFAKNYISKRTLTPIDAAVQELASAAWNALKGDIHKKSVSQPVPLGGSTDDISRKKKIRKNRQS